MTKSCSFNDLPVEILEAILDWIYEPLGDGLGDAHPRAYDTFGKICKATSRVPIPKYFLELALLRSTNQGRNEFVKQLLESPYMPSILQKDELTMVDFFRKIGDDGLAAHVCSIPWIKKATVDDPEFAEYFPIFELPCFKIFYGKAENPPAA
jgi:hypothetical protein